MGRRRSRASLRTVAGARVSPMRRIAGAGRLAVAFAQLRLHGWSAHPENAERVCSSVALVAGHAFGEAPAARPQHELLVPGAAPRDGLDLHLRDGGEDATGRQGILALAPPGLGRRKFGLAEGAGRGGGVSIGSAMKPSRPLGSALEAIGARAVACLSLTVLAMLVMTSAEAAPPSVPGAPPKPRGDCIERRILTNCLFRGRRLRATEAHQITGYKIQYKLSDGATFDHEVAVSSEPVRAAAQASRR